MESVCRANMIEVRTKKNVEVIHDRKAIIRDLLKPQRHIPDKMVKQALVLTSADKRFTHDDDYSVK